MFAITAIFLSTAAVVSGQSCGGTVSVIEGYPTVIQSPNFPNQYPPNIQCTWTVQGIAGKGLSFSATAFDLEGFEVYKCLFDALTIGAARFCGTSGPSNYITSSSMTVTFTTDGSAQYSGFEVAISVTDTLPAVHECGGDVVVVEGKNSYVVSPAFPAQYPANADCSWLIQGPAGKVLQFNTIAFDTESGFDFLAVSEAVNGVVAEFSRFSAGSGPNKLRTRTSEITAVFRSDSSLQKSGFNVSIKVEFCPSGTSSCSNSETHCIAPAGYCNDVANECPNNLDEQYCNADCGIAPIPPDLNLTRIVGGAEAIPHSWPWQVAFLTSSGSQFCGGSLVSNRWVMTAAHCCAGRTTSNSKVLLGGHSYANPPEGSKVHDLRRIVMHPTYGSSPATRYDFCLLELDEPAQFSRTIVPVCLPTAADGAAGSKCYVTGWGNTGPRRVLGSTEYMRLVEALDGGKLPKNVAVARRGTSVLHQVDVNISEQSYCNTQYNGVIDDSMVCAAAPRKDTCQGDSGGPLVCDRADGQPGFVLVGVTSWGRGCAQPGYPGVYGRTAHALDWITETMYS